MKKALTLALPLLLGTASAKTKVEFWYYAFYEGVKNTVQGFTTEFNKSQAEYEIVGIPFVSATDLNTKTTAALRTSNAPSLMLADHSYFVRLMQSGQLVDLTPYTKSLPSSYTADFFPTAWNMGAKGKERYGLPWAASTILLVYNGAALKKARLDPPETWQDLVSAADKMSKISRGSKGFTFLLDSWFFGSVVYSLGGTLLDEQNKPNLDNPMVLEAAKSLAEMAKKGYMQARGENDWQYTITDFLRTKAFMTVAPSSAYPVAFMNNNVANMQIGVAPLPKSSIAGESQLAVLKGAKPAEAEGAVEFWKFLMRDENLTKWARSMYYVPVRKSVAKTVMDDPILKAAVQGFEKAQNLPPVPELDAWRDYLAEGLDKIVRQGADPAKTLKDVQNRALKDLQ